MFLYQNWDTAYPSVGDGDVVIPGTNPRGDSHRSSVTVQVSHHIVDGRNPANQLLW